MNMAKMDEDPINLEIIRNVNKQLKLGDYYPANTFNMELHEYETSDSRSLVIPSSNEGEFWRNDRVEVEEVINKEDPAKLYSLQISLHNEKVTHIREVYNIMDLIGDLGGVLEIFLVMIGFVVSQVSRYSFVLETSQSLFETKT